MSEYTSDQIQVLKGLEGVRRRPGMYVGDTTDGSGLHHLLWELVANVIDQHLAGHATELRVELSQDSWVTVRDDGSGIPTAPMPGRSAPLATRPSTSSALDDDEPATVLETIFLRLHAGATYDAHYPHVHVSGGMHGVGLAAVNALSGRLEVETTYQGVRWSQAFERGERVSALRRHGPTTLEGTTIRLHPDPTIFTSLAFDHEAVRVRLQQLAWLNPYLRVYFQERRLFGRGGTGGWVRELASARGEIVAMHSTSQNIDDVRINVALAWNQYGDTQVHSFVNLQPITHGSHFGALWRGFADYARSVESPARKLSHVREVVAPGLVAMIHIWLDGPELMSPRRDDLRSPRANHAIHMALRRSLADNRLHTWSTRNFLRARLMVVE